MKRIGVFGGSFDPPHNAHVDMALSATKGLSLDILYLVPSYSALLKSHPPEAAVHDRLAMVVLMAEMRPEWQVLTYETDQARSVASIETVEYVRQQEPGATIYLLIGGDQGERFRQWKAWEQLARIAHIVCFARAGYTPNMPDFAKMELIPFNSDLTSSRIRERIKSADDLTGMVPPPIQSYIQNHNLYR